MIQCEPPKVNLRYLYDTGFSLECGTTCGLGPRLAETYNLLGSDVRMACTYYRPALSYIHKFQLYNMYGYAHAKKAYFRFVCNYGLWFVM